MAHKVEYHQKTGKNLSHHPDILRVGKIRNVFKTTVVLYLILFVYLLVL